MAAGLLRASGLPLHLSAGDVGIGGWAPSRKRSSTSLERRRRRIGGWAPSRKRSSTSLERRRRRIGGWAPSRKRSSTSLERRRHRFGGWAPSRKRSSELPRARPLAPLSGSHLLPLDGARRLGGDVVDDAVDALDFVDDAVGDLREQRRTAGAPSRRSWRPGVIDRAERDDVVVGAAVAHDAHGAHRQEHREGLPDLAVETRRRGSPPGRWRRPRAGSPGAPPVTSPRTRMASPGPGKGWRQIDLVRAGPAPRPARALRP